MIETSQETAKVWSKVFAVQQKGLSVVKTASNAAFKQNGKVSKYADINSILETLIPELNEARLVVACMPTTEGMVMQVTDPESGEWIRFVNWLNLTGQTAQQIGSQITYMRRYMYVSFFNLQAEDDDGNLTSGITQTYQAPIATKIKKKVEIGSAAHTELKLELEKGAEKSKYKTAADIRNDYEVSDQIMGAIQKSFTFIK
jgi:hypothetical protein